MEPIYIASIASVPRYRLAAIGGLYGVCVMVAAGIVKVNSAATASTAWSVGTCSVCVMETAGTVKVKEAGSASTAWSVAGITPSSRVIETLPLLIACSQVEKAAPLSGVQKYGSVLSAKALSVLAGPFRVMLSPESLSSRKMALSYSSSAEVSSGPGSSIGSVAVRLTLSRMLFPTRESSRRKAAPPSATNLESIATAPVHPSCPHVPGSR